MVFFIIIRRPRGCCCLHLNSWTIEHVSSALQLIRHRAQYAAILLPSDSAGIAPTPQGPVLTPGYACLAESGHTGHMRPWDLATISGPGPRCSCMCSGNSFRSKPQPHLGTHVWGIWPPYEAWSTDTPEPDQGMVGGQPCPNLTHLNCPSSALLCLSGFDPWTLQLATPGHRHPEGSGPRSRHSPRSPPSPTRGWWGRSQPGPESYCRSCPPRLP